MAQVLHFPGTRTKRRKRTKREMRLLFEENYRWYDRRGYRNAMQRAWGQVEIMSHTTQGEADSLYLLEHHPFNAGQHHGNRRAHSRSLGNQAIQYLSNGPEIGHIGIRGGQETAEG